MASSAWAAWLVPVAVMLTAAVLLRAARQRRPAAIPLVGADALVGPARRTAAIRAVVALALVGLLAGGAALVRAPAQPLDGVLARESSTVVVLDVSASVSDLVFREIARTLQGIVETAGDERRIGLVLFSDVAEEALPPGTRAAELTPFVRFFLPKRDPRTRAKPLFYRAAGPGSPPEIPYPLSPWLRTFSGGTRISTGLAAARRALERDAAGVGTVLLLSDLAEATEDVPLLRAELLAYAQEPALLLRVAPLPPATDEETELFERLLGGREALVETAALVPAGSEGEPRRGGLPLWFVVVCAVLSAGLAANELAGRPLSWDRTPREATS